QEIELAMERIKLAETDVVFIETLGGIAGTPDFGQDATVAVLAVSGGDDKAAEYAKLLSGSQALILTKSHLRPTLVFPPGAFRADLRRINPQAELIELSAFENTGLDRWSNWLEHARQQKDPTLPVRKRAQSLSELFIG